MCLHSLNKVGGINKTFMCPGIKPSKALPENFHMQFASSEINSVKIGYFQFPTFRWAEALCVFHDIIIVKIQAGYTIIALWRLWFFLNRNRFAISIKFNYSETLRVIYIVSEYRGPVSFFSIFDSGTQSFFQPMPGKNIITQNHGNTIIADKILAYYKRLSKTIR